MKYWKPIVGTIALFGATALLVFFTMKLPGMFNHEPTVPPKSYTLATVDPSIYDGYVGKYRRDDDTVMIISKENGRLFEELTGRPKREIYPFSRTDFFFKEIRAEISFITDGSGRATALELNQFGKKRLERIE